MSSIPFCKFHGFGNDYIVIELTAIPPSIDLPDLARAICHRHTGAGADGIAVLHRMSEDEGADYFCEIVNPDGSIAGFSGNGTRCAVAYLYYKGLWEDPTLALSVRSGVKNYTLIERKGDGEFWFKAEIGKPSFASNQIPVDGEHREVVIDNEILIDGRRFLFSGVNVGNPVACVFVDDFEFDWRHFGRLMETHETFPQRANIVWVKPLDRESIEIRIWERGAGETSASGTCSVGSAVLSAFTGRTGRDVSVISPGGTTKVEWREDDEILITGRADLAYCGEWPE